MTQNSSEPKNSAKTIVITRPAGDEIILRDELLERGYHVIHEPLTEIFLKHNVRMEIENALLSDPDAIIITSKHAVQALALLTEMRDMFLLCVGEATANIATQLGFDRVSVTGETVEHLIDYILDCYDEESNFLYVSGEHINTDLSEALSVRAMNVERVVAYEAIAAESLSDTIIEQIKRGQIDALTFFSNRTAKIFVALAGKAGIENFLEETDAFALSQAIADTLKEIKWQGIYSADKATLASMVSCIDNTYKN